MLSLGRINSETQTTQSTMNAYIGISLLTRADKNIAALFIGLFIIFLKKRNPVIIKNIMTGMEPKYAIANKLLLLDFAVNPSFKNILHLS